MEKRTNTASRSTGAARNKNLRTPTSEEAKAMQLKSARKKSENARERKLIRDRILERMKETDWDEMIDHLIDRAKKSTSDFESLRDTIGEKPTEKMQVSGETTVIMGYDEIKD